MCRVGLIEIHPARNPKQFVANVSVTFVDEAGQPFLTVHDFVIGRSQWDKDEHFQGRLYASVPASFYRVYEHGQPKTEMVRSVEFPQDVWKELAKQIVAAYEMWAQEQRECGGQQ
jgi:hypothetical protein